MRLVTSEVEQPPHVRHWRAMREMAAVRQIHRQYRISGLQQAQIHRLVHWRSGQRLNVGMLGAKERAGSLAGQILYLVSKFLAAVVPAPRISLGILVCEDRPKQLENLRIG